MAQEDYILANQAGNAFRSDLNDTLAAIVSNNSGATQPSTRYAYMYWADTTSGFLKQRNAANNAWIIKDTLASADSDYGKVLQVVSSKVSAVATGTGTIPYDDTKPQITEGDEYITRTITPERSDSILIISFNGAFANSGSSLVQNTSLFVGTTSDALVSNSSSQSIGNRPTAINIDYTQVSGTTSQLTFRVRSGASSSATTTFNGTSGDRKLGGSVAASIIITEVIA